MSKLASILIVDDNETCAKFMSLAFAVQGGVTVVTETEPVMALQRIRAERPDLILLDIKMPDLDGLELLSLLRAEGNMAAVVMCSGSAIQRDINQAYSFGCNGYIEKPSSLEGYRSIARTILDYWRSAELPQY